MENWENLNPADMVETTMNQQGVTDYPQIESMVQEKISNRSGETEIVPTRVPSLLGTRFDNECLVEESAARLTEEFQWENKRASTAQTVLSLLPNLPKKIEDALKPYFNYTENQQQSIDDHALNDAALYKELFEFQDSDNSSDKSSLMSSPAKSMGLLCISPISFLPDRIGSGSPTELRNCTISPIEKIAPRTRTSLARLSKSRCRLNFSEDMSIDNSNNVPDKEKQQMSMESCYEGGYASVSMKKNDAPFNTNSNWGMDDIQLLSASSSSSWNSDRMEVSCSDAPHFESHGRECPRKRRLDNEGLDDDEKSTPLLQREDVHERKGKMFKTDTTDVGYYSHETGDFSKSATVFTSTPNKGSQD